jgi:hypothetical protein
VPPGNNPPPGSPANQNQQTPPGQQTPGNPQTPPGNSGNNPAPNQQANLNPNPELGNRQGSNPANDNQRPDQRDSGPPPNPNGPSLMDKARENFNKLLPEEVQQLDRDITRSLEDRFGRENVDKTIRIIESTSLAVIVATNPELGIARAAIEIRTGRDFEDNHELTTREKYDRALKAIPGFGTVYSGATAAYGALTGTSWDRGEQLTGLGRLTNGVAAVAPMLPGAMGALARGNPEFKAAEAASGAAVSRALTQTEQETAAAVGQLSRTEQQVAGGVQQATRAEQQVAGAAQQATRTEQQIASAAPQAELPPVPQARPGQLLLPQSDPKLLDAPIASGALQNVKPDFRPNVLDGKLVVPRGTPPASIYTAEYIEQHAQQYENGASFFMKRETYERYVNGGSGSLGRPGEGQFAIPIGQAQQMQQQLSKEALIEKLGVPWSPNDSLVRIDVSAENLRKISGNGPLVRLPNGAENGANALWVSGGHTIKGVTEGLINEVPANLASQPIPLD